ncbi:MAG TPA: hypothetical protein VIS56_02160 [Candidatus Saccharimonadales bacterium]
MKRILSTAVLFVLLILTIVALAQMDANNTSAIKPNATAGGSHAAYQSRISE